MRFSSLLFAGFCSSALAVDASLDPWDIDPSCSGFEQDIKDALTESIDLASAATDSLNFVLSKIPDKSQDPDAAIKWLRISQTIHLIFGFVPNPKGQGTSTKQFIEEMRDIYALTARTLPSSQNSPPKGYNPILSQRPNAKPLIVCGDAVFKWYDADQEPEPGVGKVKDQKIFKDAAAAGHTFAGAFYHAGRWDFRTQQAQSIGHCIGNREALISSKEDTLIICDRMTSSQGKARTTPRQYKTSAKIGDDIMANWVSNPSQLYHELMHWFGGVDGSLSHIIKDQVAVSSKGWLIYKDRTNALQYKSSPPSRQELQQQGLRKQGAYGLKHIMNLANAQNNKPSPYYGPAVTTKNADSLALFSFMMYLDQYDWSRGGVARDMTRIKQKLGI